MLELKTINSVIQIYEQEYLLAVKVALVPDRETHQAAIMAHQPQ